LHDADQRRPPPAAIGPYVHAIALDNLLLTSGQVPLGLDGTMPDGIAAQTELVFDNLEAVLAEAGTSLADVVKATVFVTDFGDFATLNAIYDELHSDEDLGGARASWPF
jgi:2-iminobutanoate/2-iminopropanoate deaminase